MYKKKLLASMVLLAATGAAQGAQFQATANTGYIAPTHTDEGIEKVAASSGVAIGTTLVKLGAEYTVGDTVTFTLNQAKASNSSWPSQINSIYKGALVGSNTASNTLVNGTGFDTGDSSITFSDAEGSGSIAEQTNLIVGNTVTIGAGSTKYFILTRADATHMTISPALAADVADDALIVRYIPHNLEFTLLSSTTTAATYRLATLTGGTSTIGAYVETPLISVTPAGLTANDVTMTFAASTATSGLTFDAITTPFKMAVSKPKWTVTVAKFDGIVDVEQGKLAFVGGTAASGGDVLTYSTTTFDGTAGEQMAISDLGAWTHPALSAVDATEVSTVHTVTGDFNWLDTSATTAGVQTGGVTGSLTPVINAAGTTATITDLLAPQSTVTLTIAKEAATKAVVIPRIGFSGTSVYKYDSSTTSNVTKTTTYASLGAFTLNGAAVTAYGVPMGTTVSRFLWVNNKGSLPAAMEATVTAAGVAYGPYSVGTAAAKSSMSMASAIDTALTTAGVTLAQNSRANIEFTSPVKAGDVTISAAYKHIADADRLTLETSDTVVGAITCAGTTSANDLTGSNPADGAAYTGGVAAGTTTDSCTNAK